MLSLHKLIHRLYPYKNFLAKDGHSAVEAVLNVIISFRCNIYIKHLINVIYYLHPFILYVFFFLQKFELLESQLQQTPSSILSVSVSKELQGHVDVKLSITDKEITFQVFHMFSTLQGAVVPHDR